MAHGAVAARVLAKVVCLRVVTCLHQQREAHGTVTQAHRTVGVSWGVQEDREGQGWGGLCVGWEEFGPAIVKDAQVGSL